MEAVGVSRSRMERRFPVPKYTVMTAESMEIWGEDVKPRQNGAKMHHGKRGVSRERPSLNNAHRGRRVAAMSRHATASQARLDRLWVGKGRGEGLGCEVLGMNG